MALRDKLRVMVVDDMSTSRGLILQALDGFGIRHVRYASDGPTALKSLSQHPAHLVLSDYTMPGMDGLHLLHAMRSHDRLKRTGFILVTGRADPQILEAGKKLGLNNFLKKPFQPKELLTAIEAVVGKL